MSIDDMDASELRFLVNALQDSYAEMKCRRDDLQQRLGRVIDLCETRRAESAGGGRTDTDTLWPSWVLAAIRGEETSA